MPSPCIFPGTARKVPIDAAAFGGTPCQKVKWRCVMVAEAAFDDYLMEIRKRVCSHCIERPPGGPPCAPRGKICGVEMHLQALIASIRQVHTKLLGPYQDHDRQAICGKCALLHSSFCPCPMDYLAELIVEAVEAVDQREA